MRVIIKQHPGTGLWVSNDGRVILPPCPQIHRFKHTWSYGYDNGEGYMQVKYRGKNYKVHRLVAETHVPNPNPEEYKEVDHFPDRNPRNNSSSNLRWANRKMQTNNRQVCEDRKYGVRSCEDIKAYRRAYRAKNLKHLRARGREYHAEQLALGKHRRTCPDGKHRYLTDAEFNARFGNESQQLPLF